MDTVRPDIIINEQMKKEMTMLDTLLKAMNPTFKDTELIETKRRFENDKSLFLHKAVVFFKGGAALLADVDRSLIQRSEDRRQQADLIQCAEILEKLPAIEVKTSAAELGLGDENFEWKEAHDRFKRVLATTSD
eukprot:10281662-Karenia_brevis.AAC.1